MAVSRRSSRLVASGAAAAGAKKSVRPPAGVRPPHLPAVALSMSDRGVSVQGDGCGQALRGAARALQDLHHRGRLAQKVRERRRGRHRGWQRADCCGHGSNQRACHAGQTTTAPPARLPHATPRRVLAAGSGSTASSAGLRGRAALPALCALSTITTRTSCGCTELTRG